VRGHVDEQTLAAFRENLLPKRKTARVAAHLSSCPRCAEIDAQLAAVTAILARTPAPPMPPSLAARLDAALAAEIARSAMDASPSDAASPATAASPAGAPAPGGPAGRRAPVAAGRDATGRRPGRGRAPWRLSPRLAAAAAAVVLVAGGGYAIVRAVSGGNTTAPSGSSGASVGSGALGEPSAITRPPAAAPEAGVRGGLPLIASGTNYRAGQLPAQVSAALKGYPAPGRSPGPARAASPGVAQPAFPHLAACVSHLAGGQRPRLVDIARYDARPAAVIVVPVPGSAMVRVWVVGPGCSAHGGDVIARFSLSAPG
jgi:hypothetical protein